MRFVMSKYGAFRDRLTTHTSHVLYLPKVDQLYTPHPERPVAITKLQCCTTVELTGYSPPPVNRLAIIHCGSWFLTCTLQRIREAQKLPTLRDQHLYMPYPMNPGWEKRPPGGGLLGFKSTADTADKNVQGT